MRDILQRQFDLTADLTDKTLDGELSMEEMMPSKEALVDPVKEITALLTPEQKEAYLEHQREEHSANARLAANAELLHMQPSMALTQDQQDKAFNALYELSFAQMANHEGPPAEVAQDVTAATQWTIDRKVNALESILTADQLDRYRQIMEERMKMVITMMPKAK